jgi:hypothetical protein
MVERRTFSTSAVVHVTEPAVGGKADQGVARCPWK